MRVLFAGNAEEENLKKKGKSMSNNEKDVGKVEIIREKEENRENLLFQFSYFYSAGLFLLAIF